MQEFKVGDLVRIKEQKKPNGKIRIFLSPDMQENTPEHDLGEVDRWTGYRELKKPRDVKFSTDDLLLNKREPFLVVDIIIDQSEDFFDVSWDYITGTIRSHPQLLTIRNDGVLYGKKQLELMDGDMFEKVKPQ
jgi:hypothetical protein